MSRESSVDPFVTALGFFVEPESQPATRPLATVALGIDRRGRTRGGDVHGGQRLVAAEHVMPMRLAGTVTGTVGGPFDTVTDNAEPAPTVVPAAGVCVTMSPAFTVADATCAVTLRVSPSLFTSVDASARVSPYTLGAVCLLER